MRIFGLDGGIASIGWAVIDEDGEQSRVVAAGTRMFDAPETDKERTPTNAIRREKRGQRRVVRRRRQRMAAIRQLLCEHHLLEQAGADALAIGLNPWDLRAAALDRVLTNTELASVLGHIAKHRGFRSNARAQPGANTATDDKKMLGAIEATRDRLAQWRSVGEMFACDPEFAGRKRNRGGGYARSILRADQETETRLILEKQHQLGQPHATPALQAAFAQFAFSQKPLQDSHNLVGFCPFVPAERRAARRSAGFELFRLASRLNTLNFTEHGGAEQRLTADQTARALEDFGAQKKLSYKWLRKRLDFAPSVSFGQDDDDRDIVARSGSAAEGSYALRQAVGDAGWRALLAQPAVLDSIAAILSFRSDSGSIANGIRLLGLDSILAEAIITAEMDGAFGAFKGAGHISATAARAMLPHLVTGMVYSEACHEAGFDHSAAAEVKLEDIRNPVARKAISETLKQVRAMMVAYGEPDRIHLELARDVGKSAEERDEITKGIEKRNKQRDRMRDRFAELLARPPSGPDEMLKFELWHEQQGRCLYTDREISPGDLIAGDNLVQVDHILPWSRFGDDSFVNKTLCYASANAEKHGRTPYEWLTAEKGAAAFEMFERRVQGCLEMKGYKKRGHYLRRNAAEVEERFRARNLGDTRYATRVTGMLLARMLHKDGKKTIFARPGALTSKLRRGWGLEGLKKDEGGKRRADDRHHALDAIIVAACSESMLQILTRAFQQAEDRGMGRDFSALDQPWPGFREQALAAFNAVFVSRAERHRARGEAHAATIRQVRERNGKMVVFERKAIDGLTLKDLERVKDADRNGAVIASLRDWIEAKKPKDQLPRSPKGDVIRKVRLQTDGKVSVSVRGGSADRGVMARVDVFEKKDAKGRVKYYLVPVYPHQIARSSAPPNRAVDARKDEAYWTIMDPGFDFRFSLHPNSYVEITKPTGEILAGYFKGLDRSTGAFSLASDIDPLSQKSGIGARTLLSLRRFSVDRLGQKSEVKREVRTWHGAVCT